jgi:hypothetical protein
MNKNYCYSDKYGSYRLSLENRVICAVVAGAIGTTMSIRYNKDFRLLMNFLRNTHWGHYGDFSQCDALTPEARELSVKLHHYAKAQGCVVSAFQMNSMLLKDQVEGIRKDVDMSTDIAPQIFDSKDKCIEFVESHLANMAVGK